jgi:large subunit ribosomal protein L10
VDRAAKKNWVGEMHGKFRDAGILIFVQYKGLTVADMTALRAKVRAAGAGFKVTKNRLAKIALRDTRYHDALAEFCVGPTAVAYSDDPVSAAKVLAEFAKEKEKLVLVGGAFGDTVLGVEGIEKLAKLPSLDALRAQILALLVTPATRIAGIVRAPAGQVARVLGAYAAKES